MYTIHTTYLTERSQNINKDTKELNKFNIEVKSRYRYVNNIRIN